MSATYSEREREAGKIRSDDGAYTKQRLIDACKDFEVFPVSLPREFGSFYQVHFCNDCIGLLFALSHYRAGLKKLASGCENFSGMLRQEW